MLLNKKEITAVLGASQKLEGVGLGIALCSDNISADTAFWEAF